MKKAIVKRMNSMVVLAAVVCFLFSLSGCAVPSDKPETSDGKQPDESVQTPQEPEAIANLPGDLLSEEELVQFNEVFAAQGDLSYCLPVNGFFTSFYDDVTELDFVEFLRYYPGDGTLGNEDANEFETLSELLPDFGFHWSPEDFGKETLSVDDLPVPTHRILRSSVEETLQKYANITTADLKNTEGVLYLPEYDAYYTFTSDFGPGVFECVGGKKDGNIVRLWSVTHGDSGSKKLLTLQEADGTYYIQSYQSIDG